MKKLILISLISLLAACSTMQPPRYSISVDNIQVLKSIEGAKAEVASLSQEIPFSANCRMMGPIEPADGMSLPDFIKKALNDEFKMADMYATDAIKLTGTITKAEFSSISGMTNGYWDLGLELNSSNGESLTVSNTYSFKSGFDAITACNATADALSNAVQDLIYKLVTDPQFKSLVVAK